jgi:hypothetical protein
MYYNLQLRNCKLTETRVHYRVMYYKNKMNIRINLYILQNNDNKIKNNNSRIPFFKFNFK